jgi:glycosyltransferase involved in cell wall biosynthesis
VRRGRPDVAFICTARTSYTRNETLLAALRRSYPAQAISSDAATYPERLLRVVPRAVAPMQRSDVVVAGFLAQPLAPLFRLRAPDRPLIVDAFISLHETLTEDRRAVSPRSPIAVLAKALESAALRRAHAVLTDTGANADDLARRYGIDRGKMVPVHVSANEAIFHPAPTERQEGPFRVFYYATFLPLHGVDVIVQAAHELRAERDIHIDIVGDGPERARVQRLAGQLDVPNITFHGSVPYEALPAHMARADLCLGGHFNARNAKARRVVPGKVFQFMAMSRPVIVGDCAGTREVLRDGEDALFSPMGNAQALAAVILRAKQDAELCRHVALGGRARFLADFSLDATAARLRNVIDGLTGEGTRYAAAA